MCYFVCDTPDYCSGGMKLATTPAKAPSATPVQSCLVVSLSIGATLMD
jgi:hypothetical protein